MRRHGGRTHAMSRRARAGCQVRKREEDLNPSLSHSLSPPLCLPALPPPPPAAGVGEEQRGPESHTLASYLTPPPQSRASGETKVQERNGLRVQWENRLGVHVVVRVCRIHVAQQKRKYRRTCTIVRRPPNWMNSTQLCCPIWKISEISDVASRSLWKKGKFA
jgi:hypothetical protein